MRGDTLSPSVPGSGVTQQLKWQHRVVVVLTFQLSKIAADKLDTDLYVPIRSVIDTVQAALEPTTGDVLYAVAGASYSDPVITDDVITYTLEFRVHEWWA